MDSTEKKIVADIVAKAPEIAKTIKNGRDVEIRKTPSGITILSVDKRKL